MLIRHTPRIQNPAQRIQSTQDSLARKKHFPCDLDPAPNSDQETMWSALEIQDARKIPRDQGFPHGGFVFCDSADPRAEHFGQSVATSFSDHIMHPSAHCHLGLLTGTRAFFGDTTKLSEMVSTAIEQESKKSFGSNIATAPKVQVYFGTHSLRTFLFALHNQKKAFHAQTHSSQKIIFAGSLQLDFRRFKEELTWQDFREGLSQFLLFLDLTSSEIATLTPIIRRFCDAMCKMRYRSPFSVPNKLPWEDLQRRFGVSLRRLWTHWVQESDDFQPWRPWKQALQNIDPQSLTTHYWECLEWEQANCISLSRLKDALEDTFFLLLDKLSEVKQGGTLGLRSFVIHLKFNDDIAQSYPVHLACTFRSRTPEALSLIQNVIERLPLKKSEVCSAQDPSFFVTLTHVLEMSIEPLDLVHESPTHYTDWNLFHSVTPKSLDEICFSLSLKSKHWNLEKSFMIANLEPEAGVSSEVILTEWEPAAFKGAAHLNTAHANDIHDHCLLFEAAQNWRPIAFLKDPVSLNLKDFKDFKKNYTPTDGCYFEYVETFLANDFHWLKPCDASQPKLWVQSPSHERPLAEECRHYEWVGFDL